MHPSKNRDTSASEQISRLWHIHIHGHFIGHFIGVSGMDTVQVTPLRWTLSVFSIFQMYGLISYLLHFTS